MRSFITLAIALAIHGSVHSQSTWIVDVTGVPPGSGTNGSPYTSIQYAIEQPSTVAGDTILVRPGSYIDTVDYLGKDLTVRSTAGPLATILTATPPPATQVPAVMVGAGSGGTSAFQGFTIIGSSPPDGRGGALFCLGASFELTDCVVTANDSYEASVWIEGSDVSIADCRLANNDAAVRFLDSDAVVERVTVSGNVQFAGASGGFWLDNSSVEVSDSDFSDNESNLGAAIYAENGSALTLVDCRFDANRGAPAVRVAGSTLDATSSVFTDNSSTFDGGAAVLVFNGTGDFQGCLFQDNETGVDDYWGGALWGWDSDLTVIDSVFLDNLAARGGGAFSLGGTAEYRGCWFEGNRAVQRTCCLGGAGGGVGASPDAQATAERCVFLRNRADGTGLQPAGGPSEGFGGAAIGVDLVSCTLVGNLADDAGGGVYDADVNSCIVVESEPDSFAGATTIAYSNVEGGAPGTGNIDQLPLFTDGQNDNFHLAPGSPSIDAGDPSLPLELDNSAADQGAFPFGDCNDNGIADGLDILVGSSLDRNDNDFPDECECLVTSFCEAQAHSGGSVAVAGIAGTTSVSLNDLVLLATDAWPNRSGLFFYGDRRGSAPFGDGVRCVFGRTFRLGLVQTSAQGAAAQPVDLTQPPSPAGQITAGSRWYFQFWFRDPAAGSAGYNLSDGLDVIFCP